MFCNVFCFIFFSPLLQFNFCLFYVIFSDTVQIKIKIELCKTIQPRIETQTEKPIRVSFLCFAIRIGFCCIKKSAVADFFVPIEPLSVGSNRPQNPDSNSIHLHPYRYMFRPHSSRFHLVHFHLRMLKHLVRPCLRVFQMDF